jgi:hypothetical protein
MKKIANWIIKNMCMLSAMFILTCIGVAVITCLSLEKGTKPTYTQNMFLFISVGGMVLEMLLCLCSRWLPKWYACDGMGWHRRPQNIVNNGHAGFVHNNGTCPRCHKEVMQDSQGNWF